MNIFANWKLSFLSGSFLIIHFMKRKKDVDELNRQHKKKVWQRKSSRFINKKIFLSWLSKTSLSLFSRSLLKHLSFEKQDTLIYSHMLFWRSFYVRGINVWGRRKKIHIFSPRTSLLLDFFFLVLHVLLLRLIFPVFSLPLPFIDTKQVVFSLEAWSWTQTLFFSFSTVGFSVLSIQITTKSDLSSRISDLRLILVEFTSSTIRICRHNISFSLCLTIGCKAEFY